MPLVAFASPSVQPPSSVNHPGWEPQKCHISATFYLLAIHNKPQCSECSFRRKHTLFFQPLLLLALSLSTPHSQLLSVARSYNQVLSFMPAIKAKGDAVRACRLAAPTPDMLQAIIKLCCGTAHDHLRKLPGKHHSLPMSLEKSCRNEDAML